MNKISTFLCTALAILALQAAPSLVHAQDCDAYFPMKTGASFELTSYNAKDKLESVVTTTITEKESSGNKMVATAHAVVKDAKSKEINSIDYDLTCDAGEFKMDMRAFAGSSVPQGMEGVEISIEADDMAFPRNLAPGMTLPDASFTMKGSMNGMTIMNMGMKSVNRKVVKKESITTPAGTFECILIESDNEGKSMGMNFSTHDKSWYSLGTGIVRQETYKSDKLESYQVLTKFSK